MREHAEVGGKFVTVTNHTTYSFGIDDQEFIPAFETEEPADFMHLMMTLRETEASRWTERDTPIFVGKLVDVRTALDALDGATAELPSAEALYTAPTARRTRLRPRSSSAVPVLAAPDAPDGPPAARDHGEEGDRVGPRRAEADERADRDDREQDRSVERAS